jgi:hypothetical protein
VVLGFLQLLAMRPRKCASHFFASAQALQQNRPLGVGYVDGLLSQQSEHLHLAAMGPIEVATLVDGRLHETLLSQPFKAWLNKARAKEPKQAL